MNSLYKRKEESGNTPKWQQSFGMVESKRQAKIKKQKCISTQKQGATTEIVENNSSISEQPGNVPTRNGKTKAKKAKNTRKR